jgi:hypothetical protein
MGKVADHPRVQAHKAHPSLRHRGSQDGAGEVQDRWGTVMDPHPHQHRDAPDALDEITIAPEKNVFHLRFELKETGEVKQ